MKTIYLTQTVLIVSMVGVLCWGFEFGGTTQRNAVAASVGVGAGLIVAAIALARPGGAWLAAAGVCAAVLGCGVVAAWWTALRRRAQQKGGSRARS
jgi:hypothetical protein